MNSTLYSASRAAWRSIPVATAVMTLVLLSGCTGSQLSSDGKHDKLVFPAASSASIRGGSYPLTETLRKLRPGITKDQLAGLLGRPQFQEGFFAVREWDYLLNVTNDTGAPQMVCQLKAVFASSGVVRSFYRKCGDAVETLTDGKWQKYDTVQTTAKTAMPVIEATSEAKK
jgi:outer membrane protein assembly factor BamE (lipoprotein component of BamABCDE complex)